MMRRRTFGFPVNSQNTRVYFSSAAMLDVAARPPLEISRASVRCRKMPLAG
jgi:hypothetical protein